MRTFATQALLGIVLLVDSAHAGTVTIPAGTRLFGELDEAVTSDVDEFKVGKIVTGHLWRNVVVDGQTVIAAGAPMTLQISDIQKRKVFGRAGNVEVRAMSVKAVDGSEIYLDGGYDKQGENRVVLSATLFALVAWPTAFIKGKEAVLPPGTVFDASIPANTNVRLPDSARPTLKLGALSDLSVEVLYDEMDEKSKDLPILATLCDQPWADPFVVEAVNDALIERPIAIETSDAPVRRGECTVTHGTIDLKDLSKHFAKGINRFIVLVGASRAEVILDVEM